MSVSTEPTATARKSKLITTVCAGAITLAASLSANAAFVFSGDSQNLPITGNSFNSNLGSKGFNEMSTGAQLSVDMDGTVTFYYIAAESKYTNSFKSGSSSTMTENNDSFNWDGWQSFSINVAAGEILDFRFTSATASALTPVDNASDTNLHGLGIMTSSSTSDLVLAYNDNYRNTGPGMDSDFDDMLVRAEFTVVPVPAAVWLFGSGLIGLIGLARHRKQ
ncbi:MAG: VPLPA-CTERM sorting domain-containing protein [Gammaproteobacteria bacterium]|jgi:hypothetical protein|nr:VPLPA-CTERM sorting domain-containing protein [Gammaproteobacteria bacterium]